MSKLVTAKQKCKDIDGDELTIKNLSYNAEQIRYYVPSLIHNLRISYRPIKRVLLDSVANL